ncbi:hypothetical protein JHK87_001567 [Glycine soja]|nr:hypothetical protein JHK87_001567 [Glycine soja]
MWQDNDNFVDDGIQIEPFNIEKEREEATNDEDESPLDLSSKDIGIMKRRIANVLKPGETIFNTRDMREAHRLLATPPKRWTQPHFSDHCSTTLDADNTTSGFGMVNMMDNPLTFGTRTELQLPSLWGGLRGSICLGSWPELCFR